MIRISIAETGKSPQLLTFNATSITLGRAAKHELPLTGKGVSSTHCRIVREGDAYFIEDLGSTNGTYVNRQRLQGRRPISSQDEVVLAVYKLRVLGAGESAGPPPVGGGHPSALPSPAGQPPMAATPGPPRSSPTAHVPAPTGYPPSAPSMPPMSAPSMPPTGYPPGPPPAGGGYPPVAGHPPSTPSVPPAGGGYPPVAGHPPSTPSVPPAGGGHAPAAGPPGGGSGVPSASPMAGSGAVPASQGSGPGQAPNGPNPVASSSPSTMGTSGRSPADVAWEREWQQIDKLSQAWLSSGKNDAALLRGDKLKHARQWIAQGRGRHPQPKPLHREFIMAGSRARSMRTLGITGVGVLLLGALGAGGWYLSQTTTDDDGAGDDDPVVDLVDAGGGKGPDPTRDRGNRGASDAIAITAEGLIEVKPVVAALVAAEAVGYLPRDDAPLDAPAFRVFRDAMRRLPGRPLRGGGGSIKAVALSPDGRWAVTSEGGGSDVRLWDLDKGGVATSSYLRGHAKGVTTMEVSRDGRWLVTADADGLALRWSLEDADPASSSVRLEAHRSPIQAIDLSANGRWLVTGDDAGQVKVWDLDQSLPTAISLPKGHEGKVTGVAINADGSRVISSGDDMTARNWRLSDGRPGRAPIVVTHEELSVTAVALAGDDSAAVTGTSDGTVFKWSPSSRAPARKWEPLLSHKREVNHIEISADNGVAVSAALDNALVVWDLKAAVASASSVRMEGHTGEIQHLELFSTAADVPANRRAPSTAFTASADGTARSWNLDQRFSGIESRIFFGHEGGVRSVAVSGDGEWAITGGDGGLARVWDWQSLPVGKQEEDPWIGSASVVARGHAKAVVAVGVDRFGRRMLTGSADGTARVWDLKNPTRVHPLPLTDVHAASVRAVAVSPDPRWGATGDDAGRLVIWNIAEDRPTSLPLEGHQGEIGALAFSPDGKRLVSVSTDRTARVWSVGKDIAQDYVVLEHGDEVTQLSISGDGEWLLTGTLTEAVLWKLTGDDPKQKIKSFRNHEDDITAVALGPKGRWAATGSADRRGLLYDLSKKKPQPITLRGHEDVLRVLAFQPTGKWLATGSDDKSIRLWDLQSEHPDEGSVVLPGHQGGITDLQWSPDGRWLVSASNDGTIRLWDSRKDVIGMIEGVLVFEGHTSGSVVRQVALVPGDGDRGLSKIVSASYDATARVWPLEPEELVLLACTRAGRGLTEEEWAEHIGGKLDSSCQ